LDFVASPATASMRSFNMANVRPMKLFATKENTNNGTFINQTISKQTSSKRTRLFHQVISANNVIHGQTYLLRGIVWCLVCSYVPPFVGSL
jgi:hypothetical protein